jgi:hypothetical protein
MQPALKPLAPGETNKLVGLEAPRARRQASFISLSAARPFGP